MKKHKTLLIISIIVLFVLALIFWLYNRKSETSVSNMPAGPAKSSFQLELDRLIAKAMDGVRSTPEWIASIKKDHAAQGMTETQAVANAAIWSLKHDKKISIDTYGDGEWGHTSYVKANF